MKRTAYSLVGVVILLLTATVMMSLNAQTLPVPSAAGRVVVEVLVNGGFEDNADADNIPDNWNSTRTDVARTDKLKCNKPEQSKFFAFEGNCAFMFRGNPNGTSSRIRQPITNLTPFVGGAEVIFSAQLDKRSAVAGTKFGQTTITFSDGSKEKLILNIPMGAGRGVNDYQLVSDSFTLPATAITQVRADFRYNRTKGKFLVDAASLTVGDAASTATPTNTVDLTATATNTPSATATATGTPGATATATDTPDTVGTAPTLPFQ